MVEPALDQGREPAGRAGIDRGTGILGMGSTSAAGNQELAGELREELRRQLPDYMVPATVELLPALPLSPNGKLDRHALERRCRQAPVAAPARRRPYVAPRGAIETTLARTWQRVLRTEQVGADDDFFELGGDSILSIQIAARALAEGLVFSPQAVFEHPTVARLATIAAKSERHTSTREPAIGPSPLTPVQRWFFDDADMPERDHFNQSMLLEVRHRLAPGALEGAVRRLLARHDVLRSRFERTTAGWRQVFTEPRTRQPAPVASIDLSRLGGDVAERALSRAAARIQASLDIERGPVARFVIFDRVASDRGASAQRLLIVVHHLVMDAVSWGILLSDLERLCPEPDGGQPSELPARTTSYQAWAELQARDARSAELRREAHYWTALPAADRPLPRDFPGGTGRIASSAVVPMMLDKATTRRLLRHASAAYRTHIDDILLTALARTLAPWAGAGRVDLESHGRHEEHFAGVDLSRTIGWFTSTYPVYLGLADSNGYDDKRDDDGPRRRTGDDQGKTAPGPAWRHRLRNLALPGGQRRARCCRRSELQLSRAARCHARRFRAVRARAGAAGCRARRWWHASLRPRDRRRRGFGSPVDLLAFQPGPAPARHHRAFGPGV